MDSIKEIREFQIKRSLSDFQKGMLRLMEDLWNDQENYVRALSKFFDDEDGVLESFNPLREEKSSYVRKRILDLGGDCLRAIEEQLNRLDEGGG